MRTEELLEQSQTLTQELQSQSEELQSQQDELRRSNAELEAQARSLKASEELLQAQQEELQQTNEELQEKAALLAEQNRDIEIKNSEIELARLGLEEKAEQLALSSKYKSEFLANMSHELRTPLNSLLILAKLLVDNPEENLTDKQRDFATTIHSAGSDLLSLINEILDLSKIEAGKMDVNATAVDLAEVKEAVERTFAPLSQQKGLTFTVEVSEEAPQAIVTDEQRLHQVLKNLLSNAFKFTEEGEVRLRIDRPSPEDIARLGAASDPDAVVFSVHDTGVGIQEDKLMLIFEAFQQADGTTSRKFGGTGLGLSISREIARLLGGELGARSEYGVGSTFSLVLPGTYSPPEVSTNAEVTVQAEAPVIDADVVVEPHDAAAERILLLPNDLDDDRGRIEPDDRVVLIIMPQANEAKVAMAAARAHGFRPLVALHGDAGITLAHEFDPDGIILDLELPGPGGMAVLQDLKRYPASRHIPVHVITEEDPARRREALRAGAFSSIGRPAAQGDYDTTYAAMAQFTERTVRNLLIVEDNDVEREHLTGLIGAGDDVSVVAVGSSEQAEAALGEQDFDCVVLDLKLPGATGFDLLERIKADERSRLTPVIIYTSKDLTRREETRLKKLAETIIVKDVRSPERLVDETSLFLHRVEARLPIEQRRLLEGLHQADAVFNGKKVLIVDDDVRNVFALTSVLEAQGMEVRFAENGREGIAVLDQEPDTDIVLMDVMMPEMDGYETTRAIREMPQFERLPIISLTAKAMSGDREKSIAAGASDYITKPVNTEQLLSLMRVWLYQ
jgi:signal transduction histidine kinase/CheY-like chemotaxis protein